MNLSQLLDIQIESTIDKIIENVISTSNSNFHGLFEGNAGVSLFCAQAWIHSKNNSSKLQTELSRHIEMVVREAMQNEQHSSLATGITGTAYLLRFLVKNEILTLEDVPYLKEIDGYITTSLTADYKTGNHTLLYGAIGKGIYLFHDLEKNRNAISSIVDSLIDAHYSNKEGHIWWYKHSNDPNEKKIINFGMAYGLSSILLFLMKCYQSNIQKETVKKIIFPAIQFILSAKKEKNTSLYPVNFNNEDSEASRLAWCYGDLDIALVLFQAAKIFNNDLWKHEGSIIIENSLKRNLLTGYINYEKQNGVYDPGFCHGTAGIAYIYHKLFLLSGIPELERAITEWLHYTLLSVNVKIENKKEIARIKTIKGTPYTKSPAKNLIEGFSGIGLVLLYFLYENDDWNDIFQLDVS